MLKSPKYARECHLIYNLFLQVKILPEFTPILHFLWRLSMNKVLNILKHSILSNSCSSALLGFHSTLSFLSFLTNLTWLSSLLLPSLLLARLPAYYLDRPFGFSTHPRILLCLLINLWLFLLYFNFKVLKWWQELQNHSPTLKWSIVLNVKTKEK